MDGFVDVQIDNGDDFRMTVEHTYPVDNEDEPYTVYEIRVEHKSPTFHRVWRIYKRFTAIYEFEKKIQPLCLIPEELTLKKKRLGKNMDPAFIKLRTQEIQTCFTTIASDIIARKSSVMKEFINPHFSPALRQLSAFHIIKEGYVLIERKLATGINSLKLNKLISICSWKRKWCVITADMPWIYIFNTREDFTVPAMALDLRSCAVEVCPPKLSENGTVMYCFAVSILKDGSKSKTVTIRAESLDDLTLWNAAISDLIFARSSAPLLAFTTNVLSKESTSETSPTRDPPAGSAVHRSNSETIQYHPSSAGRMSRDDIGITPGEDRSGPQAAPLRPAKSEMNLSHSHKQEHMRPLPQRPPPVPQRPPNGHQRSPVRSPQQTALGSGRKLPPLRSTSESSIGSSQNSLPESSNLPQDQEPFQVIDEDDEDKILSQETQNDSQPQGKQSRRSIIISQDDVVPKDIPVDCSTEAITLSESELLPGETITLKLPNIYHVHINQGSTQDLSVKPLASCILGTLFLTNYKLVFKPVQSSSAKRAIPTKTFESCPCCTEGCSVPIAGIQQIDRFHGVSPAYGKFSCFIIRSKNFHDLRFNYVSGSSSPSTSSMSSSLSSESEVASGDESFPDDLLEPLIFHNYILKIFAFNKEWVSSFDPYTVQKYWCIYDQARELARLGFPGEKWRITTLNKGFAYCDTYPELLCVPAQITDQELIPLFAFRSKGRIPNVVWTNKENGTALLRCGQPSVGVKSKRCLEDEKLMDSIGACNSLCKTVFILDARPRLNARANQFMGRGFEQNKFYANCSILFLGIDNIHKMSEGEAKMRKAIAAPGGDVRGQSAKWLQYISLIVSGAVEIVSRIEKGMSIIVHCSDGWDRTPQLTSLALILLDPYYRTLDGFIVLIEKEWISFGHMFAKRTRQVPTKDSSGEQSPIFMQFIDCVRQMNELCPKAFQFNEAFLITILDELFAGRFGTFLFDSLAKRKAGKAEDTTIPLWLFIDQKRQSFINPGYDPKMDLFHTLAAYKRIPATLWENYYTRWEGNHNSDLGVPLRSTWRENLL